MRRASPNEVALRAIMCYNTPKKDGGFMLKSKIMTAIRRIFKPSADNVKIYRLKIWIRILCILLCVVLAGIACSCLALSKVSDLKWKYRGFSDGSGFEADKIRIYVDQGHNPAPYHNNGAEGNGLYEQDLTFDIGHLLAELLIEDGRFDVCLSRPDETTVLGTDNKSSLQARVDGAEGFDADYFISLHINSFTQDTANGIEVFVSNEGGESYGFGSCLLQGMIDSTNLRNRGMKLGSELYVLGNATVPAALLEMGFISNSEDAALLSEHPELFAQGIYNGILDYFESLNDININIMLWLIGILAVVAVALITIVIILIKKSKEKVTISPVITDEE